MRKIPNSALKELEKEKRKTESHPKEAHLQSLENLDIKCFGCKSKIFWVSPDSNLVVCSHCHHLWLLVEDKSNPSRRDSKRIN